MDNKTDNFSEGPYRIVRVQGGKRTYYGGHHPNGQVNWVDVTSKELIRYPTAGMAGTVRNTLKPDSLDVTINVIRAST